MKIYYDCLPCLLRQAIDTVKLVTNNKSVQEKVIKEIMNDMASFNFNETPPFMASLIQSKIKKMLNIDDPYKEIKDKFNHSALKLSADSRKLIDNSSDKLETAIRISIAGNIIDFGVYSDLTEEDVKKTINDCLNRKIIFNKVEELKERIDRAEKILFLGDNAGEIVFDKLLIENLPIEKITYVVKKEPALNDSTMFDAAQIGMNKLVKVIDNGSNVPGTDLKQCSAEFLIEYEKSDLIISKGQGNYETLSDDKNKEIFFLLKAKCPVIADNLGCKVGDIVLKRNR
ncbi:hypothetical protein SAMN00017405_1990 [Desulfonispora thiosulfatigenes DSM 11270]|uniref:Damage-control phosphatase ARMT1-like metal-binding domain-containing protein n=1 Tax=Desulfonispora thiosulfatigenes DSM 11270 TaxID=656914 RepID=A0A1W1UI43_DESTI|nr:ARMT1-like domain-containing protein [Desulfonispora thiosulfatigenes]SMB80776.1 hypothetical protein SAMN00017405_1990 [Desulfonispora thiosulfatigenes DSM 11270]